MNLTEDIVNAVLLGKLIFEKIVRNKCENSYNRIEKKCYAYIRSTIFDESFKTIESLKQVLEVSRYYGVTDQLNTCLQGLCLNTSAFYQMNMNTVNYHEM